LEKGVVEKNIQDSRRLICLEAQSIKFSSFDALNAWLAVRCRALWGALRHPEFKSLSIDVGARVFRNDANANPV
jgi:hypothetical protein